MAEKEFWNLTHNWQSTARLAEWVDGEIETEQVLCPANPGHRRGGKRLTDLNISLRGVGVRDFVWTWYSECLIQEHVRDLFKAEGITGFDVKPVEASFKRLSEKEPPPLWELVTTGWAGMAHPESGIRRTEHCRWCGLLHYTPCTNPEKLIDASKWDGCDFFMVWPLPGFIFVTDRVAQTIRSKRLEGALLKRPKDMQFSNSGFGPGRLSYWMPPDRARELGAALGID